MLAGRVRSIPNLYTASDGGHSCPCIPFGTHAASCSLPKAAVPIRTIIGVHVILDMRLQADGLRHHLREHLVLLGSVLLQVPRILALVE